MRKTPLLSTAVLSVALLAAALPTGPGEQDAARAKELLAPFAGTWETEFSMPGQPAPSKGAEVVKALPHGLSLTVTSNSDMGPMGPYEGHGLIGYDRRTGKYQHCWTDNMDPGISVSEGRFSEDGKSFIIEAEHDMGAGPVPVVMTMHVDDVDHMTWTMTARDAAEGSAPMMTMKYTRKR